MQADGTIKTVKSALPTDDLNQQNIQLLIEMGYEYD